MLSNAAACKKNAVNRIMDYLCINESEILSFGDDLNDIGMFEASGTGVAMANSVPELKEIADYITLSNDEDGIADYINKFVL
jgi:hydroxymethylpyrimidine pyrophosphatase-like HAD family hydrolase